MYPHVSKIELGCGSNKREDFFGIDVAPAAGVDLVLDVEREPWPFADNQIDYIYSRHAFEHMFNIALEMGVFLTVNKEHPKAVGPQYPVSHFGYQRNQYLEITQESTV